MEETQIAENKSTNRAAFLLIRAIIAVAFLVILLGAWVVKMAFFEQRPPRTAVERDLQTAQAKVQANPKDAKAHVELGVIQWQMGENNKAIKEFKTAAKLDPKYSDAHYNLGLLYKDQGKADEAEKELKAAIKIYKGHALAFYELGQIYLDQKDYDQAVEALTNCTTADPFLADGHYYLGVAYEKSGNKDLAVKEYNETVKYIPDHSNAKKALNRLGVK